MFFLEDLGKSFEDILHRTWPYGMIKLIRHGYRKGLIRARLTGAKAATGDVLLFMDAHVEVTDYS